MKGLGRRNLRISGKRKRISPLGKNPMFEKLKSSLQALSPPLKLPRPNQAKNRQAKPVAKQRMYSLPTNLLKWWKSARKGVEIPFGNALPAERCLEVNNNYKTCPVVKQEHSCRRSGLPRLQLMFKSSRPLRKRLTTMHYNQSPLFTKRGHKSLLNGWRPQLPTRQIMVLQMLLPLPTFQI